MYSYSTSHMRPAPDSPSKETAASLLYPCVSSRDMLRRMGKKPKDHHRTNLQRMRESAKAERVKRAMAEIRQPEARTIPAKYISIPSKIKQDLLRPSTAPPGGTRPFLRAREKNTVGAPPKSARPYTARPKNNPPVPRAASVGSRSPRSTKDADKDNKQKIKMLEKFAQQKAHQAEEAAIRQPPKMYGVDADKFGRVPWYLVTRRAEEEDAKQQEEAVVEAAKHPGKLLKDEERLSMLHQLKESFAHKTVELQRMPITVETYSLKKYKAELERDLDTLEKGIRRYQNPKVYVAR